MYKGTSTSKYSSLSPWITINYPHPVPRISLGLLKSNGEILGMIGNEWCLLWVKFRWDVFVRPKRDYSSALVTHWTSYLITSYTNRTFCLLCLMSGLAKTKLSTVKGGLSSWGWAPSELKPSIILGYYFWDTTLLCFFKFPHEMLLGQR